MNRPKVLQIGSENFGAGGRSVIAYNLTYPLITDYEIDFLALGELKNPQFHQIIEKNGGKAIHVEDTSNKLSKFRKILKILKSEKFDIIHINADDASEALVNFILSKLSGARTIVHAHSTSPNIEEGFVSQLKRVIARIVINCFVDDRLTCSIEAADYMFGNKSSSKATIIKNGIDIDKFSFNKVNREQVRKALNISDRQVVIGTIGRITTSKNPYFIVELIKQLQRSDEKYLFLWIGDGEERGSVEQLLANEIDNKRVFMLGNQENPSLYLQAMDLFVLPSLYEGFGIVNIEAQASGLSCIVSSSIPDLAVVNPNFYRLNTTDNLWSWVEKIEKMDYTRYLRDPYRKLKAAGFDIKDSANVLRNIYNSLL